MEYIAIGILFLMSLVLSYPMVRKPLSEDDGNWFYLPVFYKRGIRLYKNFIQMHGYFGVPWLASMIYNLFNFEKLNFFYYFKIVWYALNAVSIYWLTFCFWHNHVLAFIAGLIFAIIVAIPNTLFVLTYAEHLFIFPINLSIIFAYYGLNTGALWYFLLAGLMAAWAVQIKPTALLFGIILPGVFCISTPSFIPLIYYTATFVGFSLVPILIITKYGKESRQKYFFLTFGPVISLFIIIINKLKLSFLIKHINNNSKLNNPYIKAHHSKSLRLQWLSFKRFMFLAMKDLYLILVLAATQVVLLFINFDIFVFSVFILFITFLLMQQAQKNYYTPHFNSCWAPISILAAKTVWDMWPYMLKSGALGYIVMVFMMIESIKVIKIIVRSFSISERNSFGYLGPMIGALFRLPESIGQYIQQNSKENEKLLVWGDQPSIYLYSKREAFNTDFFFLYTHHGIITIEEELKKLLDSMRERPPELLLFYNYKANDGWDVKRLQEAIGIPYKFLRSFKITDNQGKTIKDQNGIVYDFPLYRRDDKVYKDVLLDRALLAKRNGDTDKALKHLNDILEISPEDFEASIRLSMIKNNTDDVDSARSYLEKQLAENHNAVENAILLRLLAEIEVAVGNTDSGLKNYEKSHNSNPNDFRIHNGLGELSFSMDRIDDAFEYFKKAIVLHPYSSDILNNIGVLLSQSGKRDDAIKYFQKALSFMPSHPDARKNMEALT